MKCPCHSQNEYQACCAPYHQGEPPPNPTALMRSRYSAYALGNVEYIIKTTHSQNPDRIQPVEQWKAQIKEFCESTDFTGLEILDSRGNTVTFRAYLGQRGSFTEKSEFAQEEGYWRYKAAL